MGTGLGGAPPTPSTHSHPWVTPGMTGEGWGGVGVVRLGRLLRKGGVRGGEGGVA